MQPVNTTFRIGKHFPMMIQKYVSFIATTTGYKTRHFSLMHNDWKAVLPTQLQPKLICACGGRIVTTLFNRNFATSQIAAQKLKKKEQSSNSQALTESKDRGAVTLSLGEKVKENAKTATYGGVILIGLAVSGAMLYVLLSELFSSNSPNNIYTHSFKLCKLSQDVQDVLGTPIKCYGEETRRGWRRHVAHTAFLQDNVKYLRMRYYIEGGFRKATVHVEKKMNDRGNYEYVYLIVDVDGYPPRRINVNF